MNNNMLILCLTEFGKEIMFDDDENESNGVLEKVWDYAERTVPNLNDYQFKRHFRMSPHTFEILLHKLHQVTETRTLLPGHPSLPLDKQLMILIWYLGNIESFRSVAERFGISKSTAWNVLQRMCKMMLTFNTRYKVLWWPEKQRGRAIIAAFNAMNGFPGVIGCIDGTHIRVGKPKTHGNSYINRKHYASIVLQVVCDHQMLFLDVHAGQPGSMHDAQVFQKKKNKKLSQILASVENSIASLNGRFRRLKYVETVRLDLIVLITVTACILHNVCLLDGDNATDIIVPVDSEVHNEQEHNGGNEGQDQEGAAHTNAAAIRKRNYIANHL